jgi:endonuclease/exonuclease/phosphatase family metal-dependent hydrolase
VLHWNVQWGGGLRRAPRTWAAQRAKILQWRPDIVVLSEPAARSALPELVRDFGPGAECVGIPLRRASRNWLVCAVCSRWPVRLEERVELPGGEAMSAVVEVRGHPVRFLIVDGKSNPFRSRLPFLRAIVDSCQSAASAGRPYDGVVGDFNTPSRSIGFDALCTQGYQLASRSSNGWRGTFPSWLPLYDIDHVWLRPGLRVRSCTLFNGSATDHRGQFVRILTDWPG